MKTLHKINHSLTNSMMLWFDRLEKGFDTLGRKLF